MSTIDSEAAVTMRLSSELMDARETIRRQRRTIWALVAALRAQQIASATLADLADFLLADADE